MWPMDEIYHASTGVHRPRITVHCRLSLNWSIILTVCRQWTASAFGPTQKRFFTVVFFFFPCGWDYHNMCFLGLGWIIISVIKFLFVCLFAFIYCFSIFCFQSDFLSDEDRLKELGLFSLKKAMRWSDSGLSVSKGELQEKREQTEGSVVMEEGEIFSRLKTVDLG